MNIELSIEKIDQFYTNAPIWYQAYITIGDMKQKIGKEFIDYNDCIINCEKIVEEFSKQKIYVLHSEIYNEM